MKLNFDKGVLVPQINDEVARIPLERTRDQAKKGGFDQRATKPLTLITAVSYTHLTLPTIYSV